VEPYWRSELINSRRDDSAVSTRITGVILNFDELADFFSCHRYPNTSYTDSSADSQFHLDTIGMVKHTMASICKENLTSVND
jgi:hypothetical protein